MYTRFLLNVFLIMHFPFIQGMELEGFKNYTKLHPGLIKSIFQNCPSLLQLKIKLINNRQTYARLKIPNFSINKMLLYGPQGSGKSTMAKAIADRCKLPRQPIFISDIIGLTNFKHFFGKQIDLNEHYALIFDDFMGIPDKKGKLIKKNEESFAALIGLLDVLENYKNILLIVTTSDIKRLPTQIKDRFCGSMYKVPSPDEDLFESEESEIKDEPSSSKSKKAKKDKKSEYHELQHIKFEPQLKDYEKKQVKKQKSKLSLRQKNEANILAKLFALKKIVDVDEQGLLSESNIPVKVDDYKNALNEINRIKKEYSPSGWKTYSNYFYRLYPFLLPLAQWGIMYYLQQKKNETQMTSKLLQLNPEFAQAYFKEMINVKQNWLYKGGQAALGLGQLVFGFGAFYFGQIGVAASSVPGGISRVLEAVFKK
jgi:hypothetical protein